MNDRQEWEHTVVIRVSLHDMWSVAWRPHTLEFATSCFGGRTRVWRLQSEAGKVLVQMVWSTDLRGFRRRGCCDTVGLGANGMSLS